MTKHLRIGLLVLTVLFIGNTIKAQTVLPPSEVQVLMEPTTTVTIPNSVADTLLDPMALLSNMQMTLTVEVVLQDSSNTNKIHVKVGRTNGGTDISQQTFDYDGTAPSGTTYSRITNILMLGIGNHNNINPIYAEVTIEDHNGVISAPTKFSIE